MRKDRKLVGLLKKGQIKAMLELISGKTLGELTNQEIVKWSCVLNDLIVMVAIDGFNEESYLHVVGQYGKPSSGMMKPSGRCRVHVTLGAILTSIKIIIKDRATNDVSMKALNTDFNWLPRKLVDSHGMIKRVTDTSLLVNEKYVNGVVNNIVAYDKIQHGLMCLTHTYGDDLLVTSILDSHLSLSALETRRLFTECKLYRSSNYGVNDIRNVVMKHGQEDRFQIELIKELKSMNDIGTRV